MGEKVTPTTFEDPAVIVPIPGPVNPAGYVIPVTEIDVVPLLAIVKLLVPLLPIATFPKLNVP